jgi:hypothetical protein
MEPVHTFGGVLDMVSGQCSSPAGLFYTVQALKGDSSIDWCLFVCFNVGLFGSLYVNIDGQSNPPTTHSGQ